MINIKERLEKIETVLGLHGRKIVAFKFHKNDEPMYYNVLTGRNEPFDENDFSDKDEITFIEFKKKKSGSPINQQEASPAVYD